MIVAVFVQHDDHEPYIEYVDSEKLVGGSYVDTELLKAINKKKKIFTIDACDWEDYPDKFPDDDIGISAKANVKNPDKFDRAIIMIISFG